ncbi:MAG: bifunctional metallophosphatase/5'-nucleotidase [Saprospiraceae bacterium]
MKIAKMSAWLLLVLAFSDCQLAKKTATPAGKDDGLIEVTFLQMNDVYEISPSLGDNTGGLARVATIRRQLLAKNPNTLTVLSGDFISPSVIGTLKNDGKRIRGKQMVESLNALGLDWVVFGNHEFDYDDLADLQSRIDESRFTWMGANARLKTGTGSQQFFKNVDGKPVPCPDNQVLTLQDADGTTLRLGVFGVLINTGRKPYVEYSDWFGAAQKNYAELAPKTDVVVALTHLGKEDDKQLAALLPHIPLIMGGHDHDNQIHKVGKTTVAKADANAKTVYVHTLIYNTRKKTYTLRSELRKVDASIADEPATAAVVAKWEKIMHESLATAGFSPATEVTVLQEPLDCREGILRFQPAKSGQLIAEAMLAASKNKPDCAILNSGSVRVDDILTGSLTELDVVRMLPFGGPIAEVEMKGSFLRRTLEAGWNNKGNGGFLQWANIRRDEATGAWSVGNQALDDTRTYHVTLPDFLLSGSEQNMGFLQVNTTSRGTVTTPPEMPVISRADPRSKTDIRNDIRLVLIEFLHAK